jgi:hypothetical protein
MKNLNKMHKPTRVQMAVKSAFYNNHLSKFFDVAQFICLTLHSST